jgi:hypothetical protein
MNTGPARPKENHTKLCRKHYAARPKAQPGWADGKEHELENGFTTLETNNMRRLAIALVSTLCIGVVGMASADESKKPSGEIGNIKLITAEVIAIDLTTRTVTLRGPAGDEFPVRADTRVKNLAQVHVGDRVDISYQESLVWNVKKASDGKPNTSVQSETISTKPGSKPAGTAVTQTKMTATIDAIDLGNGTVTLKGPEGNRRTFNARDPKNLQRVQVGDLVDITYTEALAVRVRPAKPTQ